MDKLSIAKQNEVVKIDNTLQKMRVLDQYNIILFPGLKGGQIKSVIDQAYNDLMEYLKSENETIEDFNKNGIPF
jgi:hypothetical protein